MLKQEENTKIKKKKIALEDNICAQAKSDKNKQTISNVKKKSSFKKKLIRSTRFQIPCKLNIQDTKVNKIMF